MGFLDALFGRRKPVQPDLDQLFALPSAAVTLQAAAGFRPTGQGSVCFAGVEGGAFGRLQEDIQRLLGDAELSQDRYGYTWVLSRHTPEDVAGLVNDLHAVNTFLQDGGFGPQLLCSLVTFADERDRALAVVYLYKRGTFYPFAPLPGGGEKRDNALELQTKALLGDDLRVEDDLARWFPVWGAPGLG
jgi:hypothetical protein